MRKAPILLILLSMVLLMAEPIPFITTKVILPKDGLHYGKRAELVINVCNKSTLNLNGISLTYVVNGAELLGPQTASLGPLRRNECARTSVVIIPSSKRIEVTINAIVLSYVGSNRLSYQGTYKYVWTSKTPAFLVEASDVGIDKMGEYFIMKIRNIGTMTSYPLKVIINSSQCMFSENLFNLEPIKPNQSASLKVYFREYSNMGTACTVDVRLMDNVTSNRFVLRISKPRLDVSLKLGPSIEICSQTLKGKARVYLSSNNALMRPSTKVIELGRGCSTIRYELINPQFPLLLTAILKTNLTEIEKSMKILALPLEIEHEPESLIRGTINIIRLKLLSIYNFKKMLMKLKVNTGSVDVTSIYVNNNESVPIKWYVPQDAPNEGILSLDVGGAEYNLRFVIKKIEPIIGISIVPNKFLEGSVIHPKICVSNNWTQTLKNVVIEINTSSNVIMKFIGILNINESKCFTIKMETPWGKKNIEMTIVIKGDGFESVKKIKIPLLQNPNVAMLKISINPKSLRTSSANATLEIHNLGRGWAMNTLLTVSSEDLIYPTSSIPLGDIPPQGSKTIILQFNIPPNRKKESINLILNYCSGMPNGPCKPQLMKSALNLVVSPYIPPSLQVLANKIRLISGRTTRLNVTIENVGGDKAVAPSIEFKDGKYITIIGNKNFVLNEIPAGRKTVVSLLVRVSSPTKSSGDTLSYVISYSDPWGEKYKGTGSLSFEIKRQRLPKIVVGVMSGDILIKGREKYLLLKVSNVGRAPAKNVELTAYANNVILNGNTQKKIDILMPGQMVLWRIRYSIPLDSPVSSTQLSVTVNYSFDNQTHAETYNFNMRVIRGPQLDLSDITVTPPRTQAGKSVSVSTIVVNTGDAIASDCQVSIKVPPEIAVVGPSQVYLGNVPPQSNMPVAFVLKPKENVKPGTYVVKVILNYRFKGVDYKIDRSVPIIVMQGSIANALSMNESVLRYVMYTVILIVIIIVIVYRLLKRREKVEVNEE